MYCTDVLHFSEHAAYLRIEAARTARRFPEVLELLAEGSLTLTTVGLLKPHLTADNHGELLEAARHKSKREVEKMDRGTQAVAGGAVDGAEGAGAQDGRCTAARRGR